jgi:predicted XRE-type DNA-binding protein
MFMGVFTDQLTQAEAAERCGVTQPRINDLLRGRIARFSLDALVNIAAALGRKITVKVEDAA